jgi:hydroxymethylglutaryl-CoA lyase
METLKVIECPRDAMQGMKDFVPTDLTTEYINLLLKCGFDTIDFGSFVSPKAIPQMRDTAAVLKELNLNERSKLLAIVANERGAEDALQFSEIDYLGYPFSVSEVFQMRNTNATIEESLERVENIQNMVTNKGKKLVVYLSMGFGNPYDEIWNPELVLKWSKVLNEKHGVEILALSDTIGIAKEKDVSDLFKVLKSELKQVEFGAHFHTRPETTNKLIKVAYDAGCRRFDSAIRGFGGCPMAKDDLTGNLPTEALLNWFNDSNIEHSISSQAFDEAYQFSSRIFL